MKLTRCDQCKKEKEHPTVEWLRLVIPIKLDAHPGFLIAPGYHDLDFCSAACVVAYLTADLR